MTLTIRRIRPEEFEEAHRFVQALVNETYAFVWHGNAPSIDETDWSAAWVADDGAAIVAVMLSNGDVIDDLWIASAYRRKGLGSSLLNKGEEEIAARGFQVARLRVVSGNDPATHFYEHHGWLAVRHYPHGRLPIEMIDFEKQL